MTQITREAVEAIKEHSKHWDFCPICREGLDTGLECAHCGYDMMPVVNMLQFLWERCEVAEKERDAAHQHLHAWKFQYDEQAAELARVREAHSRAWRTFPRLRLPLPV